MHKISFQSKSKLATLAGIVAIIMWSSNVAVSKTAMNDLGAYSAAFYIYFFSGILNILILLVVFGKIKILNHFKELPLSYYLKTGIFILFNNVFFFLALGLAKTNEELIIVALLNYLWPVLITVFRVPIYHEKVRPVLFIAGIAAAVTGIIIALLQGYKVQKLLEIAGALNDNFLAFLFAFIGAVSWAIYSNLIKKYDSKDDVVALPLIFIFSGFVFYMIELFSKGAKSLSLNYVYSNPFLIYTIIGPTCLGYLFWFIAMKYGNRILVSSLSYLIPLGSVFILSQIHQIPVRPMFWISAVLIITGALLGMKSVKK
jgi:drug/metabolite transporter (DMT)-like permease